MAYWYEGNRNQAVNRREENGVTYYIRGVREVEGVRYERYAVHTHFIERGEVLWRCCGSMCSRCISRAIL